MTIGAATTKSLERLGRFGLPVVVVVVIIVFWALEPSTFGTASNIKTTLDQQMPVLIAALAAMVPLIIGEFDLSVGATVSLANTLVVGLATRQSLPVWVAIALALLAGASVGLVNGFVVVRLKVNAFVATLATGTVVTGLSLAYWGRSTCSVPQADSPTWHADERFPGSRTRSRSRCSWRPSCT
jgi:ribose transport system permease protein